ncbi:ShlB/FhaC/HecB family hemolysin secretion/activation protein [Roseimicrobium sp. ORNL1]|uniref:ShlB/FhaC/HecB family hemolysin secretion/activation protein n=1 Tax=Roseimicrobium sp. ORNL1 TaxID=2711231 RepID=UPI0013E1D10E|nr:ShlB/FhaC/HecB family hemolysin secretion/activation protein [Roseimicrobium sp. ORNL1]QIF05760.1 ShlB/FhaC/HecB family hemolysin secretion/activation protein [Roseimicrobium sp. ORNL1]
MSLPKSRQAIFRLHPGPALRVAGIAGCLFTAFCAAPSSIHGAQPAPAAEQAPAADTTASAQPTVYIREYRVQGSKKLGAAEIGKAVYPFLGPGRTVEDVEAARAALETAFHDKGLQSVSVEVPQQSAAKGIIVLRVVENKVGRLRVHGARYFLPSDIKRMAPSLAEGTVPDFNQVPNDLVKMQSADRQVSPELRPGVEPGTVDVDLNVKDTLPLHGSIELNNRYSPDTVPLRLNASLSYGNLWQLGHSIGASFQVAPERPEDATVYSGYYITRVPGMENLNLMFMGTKQDSDVSTLGGAAVAGRGEILGVRGLVTLPSLGNYYQSLSFGLDWKNFDEDVVVGDDTFSTPIQYWPISINYGGSWLGKDKKSFTEFNTNVTFHVRGTGSDPFEFDNKRYLADGAFIYFRGDVSHQHDLPRGFRVFGKVQGQIADSPLINSEQYAGGGLGTVRGYLESTALGDSGLFGTLELQSPSFIGTDREEHGQRVNEWRVYGFVEGGSLWLREPLPDQEDTFELASVGLGSRLRLFGTLNGSVDVAYPLIEQGTTEEGEVFVSFRVWTDF